MSGRTPGARWLARLREIRAAARRLRQPEIDPRGEAARLAVLVPELREVRGDVGELIGEVATAGM